MSIPLINSVSTGAPAINITDITVPHTVASGLTDSVMVVLVNSANFSEVASATWNGIAMTLLPTGTSNEFWCTALYLLNPVSGTHNVAIHWDVIQRQTTVTVLTVTGAGRPIFVGEDNGFGTTSSASISTSVDDALLVDFIMSQLTTHTQGVGQTEQANFLSVSGTFRQSVSTKDAATPGSYSMEVTLGVSNDFQMKVLQLSPIIPSAFIPQVNII